MLNMIIAPVMGGIIGYITNDIAIKMLFHPRKPVYIGKWRVPFTPGLIPAQKNRIAASVGRVVAEQLLDTDTVKDALLSPQAQDAVRSAAARLIESYKDEERTVEELMTEYIGEERFLEVSQSIEKTAARLITRKVLEAKPAELVVHFGLEAVKEKFSGGFMSMFINDDMIMSLEETILPHANELAEEKLPEIIGDETGKIINSLKNKRAKDLYEKYNSKIPEISQQCARIYAEAVKRNTGNLLEKVDIRAVVEEKISGFDAAELERMIFGIMKRELRAIVYLGALLGFILGLVNAALLLI